MLPSGRQEKPRTIQNHRMVWRDIKAHPGPTPASISRESALEQAIPSPIQAGLEHFQGQGIHSFSRQPVLVSHHTHRKEFLCIISSFQFESITPCPSTISPRKKSLSSFLEMNIHRPNQKNSGNQRKESYKTQCHLAFQFTPNKRSPWNSKNSSGQALNKNL